MAYRFDSLALPGLFLIKSQAFADARGWFMESYKASDFTANGIAETFVQDNHSLSTRGVLRGLHFQRAPHSQGKLVRVAAGSVWDVAVDVRPGSPSYGKWYGVELSGENRLMLYIPPGFAHGFLTLSEEAHFLYKCTHEYDKGSEGGIRWDDPDVGIEWPIHDVVVSDKDAALPCLKNAIL